jgi:hypothetical protein
MPTIPFIDEDHLVDLVADGTVTRQQWARWALCSDQPKSTYFPDGDSTPPAHATTRCAACPVQIECLATALIHESADGYRSGWWAGTSPDEREQLANGLNLPNAEVESVIDLTDPPSAARCLREAGKTIPVIAAELGCTERSVYRYLAANAA